VQRLELLTGAASATARYLAAWGWPRSWALMLLSTFRRGTFHNFTASRTNRCELARTTTTRKQFQWLATTDQILEKVRRGRVSLDTITN
jgi:hypothetical protein